MHLVPISTVILKHLMKSDSNKDWSMKMAL